MVKHTTNDVLKIVKEKDVRFIRLQFTDVFGILKNVAVMASNLPKILEEGCLFDGSSIDGFARIEESDMILMPDPNTFELFPWKPDNDKEARLICDVLTSDGKPYAGCPRNILKQQIARAQSFGYTMNCGPELEFFLFQSENGHPTTLTHDDGGYFDLAPIDRGEDARREMCLVLEEMGFHIEASHHECSNAQHEIDFKYDDILTTADNVMTFKIAVKTVAQKHGLHATFMPKPIYETAGSGMHFNMSLSCDGKNIFADAADPLGLSKIAYNSIAGIMQHVLEFTAVTNPCVNSYKRLVPGYEAPCYVAWSVKNRSPLIRIPSARGSSTRIELRSPDPSCNPYLAFALVLAAALNGIEDDITPIAPVNCNIFQMTPSELQDAGIFNLPTTLIDSLKHFENSGFVQSVLGEEVVNTYSRYKRLEWGEYSSRVHQWELDTYFTKY